MDELSIAELTRRLLLIEARCFALQKLYEALIATTPDRGRLQGAWHARRANAEVVVLQVTLEAGSEAPTTLLQHEHEALKAGLTNMETSFRVPHWSPPQP